jgi:hypothetical protein
MPILQHRRLVLALALSVSAACSDDDATGPTVEPENVVERCMREEIGLATSTQTITGTINASDCTISGDPGRFEVHHLPQTSFGTMNEVWVQIDANFDAILAVMLEDGTILIDSDNDIGGDEGREEIFLPYDLETGEPDYYIIVYAWPGESGSYTLTVGPADPL